MGWRLRRFPDPGKKIGLGHSEEAFRPVDQNQQHGDGQQELARAEEIQRFLDRMQRLGGGDCEVTAIVEGRPVMLLPPPATTHP